MLQYFSDGLRRRKRPTTIKGKDVVMSGKKSRTVNSEFPSYSHPQTTERTVSSSCDQSQQIITNVEGSFDTDGSEDFHYYQALGTSGRKQSYNTRKERLTESWEKVRGDIFKAFTESSAPPNNCKCYECGSIGEIRCQSCGPFTFYCCECSIKVHKSVNVFHLLEIWKDGLFMPYSIPVRSLVRTDHSCSDSYMKMIACIDGLGNQHSIQVTLCHCEPEAVTLIRYQLWPATPKSPVLAFHFDLLDWLESLLLESQVSVRDFVLSMKLRRPWYSILFGSRDVNVYPTIIDSFEEYRFFKYRQRYLSDLCPAFDKGTTCLACPKNEGDLFESFDALFGLSRKKSSGKSVREPLHGDLMFADQTSVDNFVMNSSNSSTIGCNQFLAGHPLKSSGRFSALDETAVFGRACRHEFPKRFINLKHGERLAYSVWMLKELKESVRDGKIKIHILYDIACMLDQHLKASTLLEGVQLAIPIFHVYGHQAKCHVKYSPRLKEAFALTDGEVMERLWSRLRRYSRMTKEMRPAHRIDVLTDVFLHIGREANLKLATLLPARLRRATMTLESANKQIQSLLSTIPVQVTDDLILQWTKERYEALILPTVPKLPSWKEDYCNLIDIQETTKHDIQQPNCSSIPALVLQLNAVEQSMTILEKHHQISQRWSSNSPDYKAVRQVARHIKQSILLRKITVKTQERFFMLDMKAKYASGHELSQKISKQITSITSNLKALVEKYNKGEWESHPRILTIQEVCSRDMALSWTTITAETTIPLNIKNKLIDTWSLRARAKEETELLKEEMNRTICHAFAELKKVNDYVDGNQVLNTGIMCLVKQLLVKKSVVFMLYLRKFQGYIDPQPVPLIADNLLEACLEQAYPSLGELPASESNDNGQLLLFSALDHCDISPNVYDILDTSNVYDSFDQDEEETSVHDEEEEETSVHDEEEEETSVHDEEEETSVHDDEEEETSVHDEEETSVHELEETCTRESFHKRERTKLRELSAQREGISIPESSNQQEKSNEFETFNITWKTKTISEEEFEGCDVQEESENAESSDSEEGITNYVNMSNIMRARAIQRFEVEQWRLHEKDKETLKSVVAQLSSECPGHLLDCHDHNQTDQNTTNHYDQTQGVNTTSKSSKKCSSFMYKDSTGLKRALAFAQVPPEKHHKPHLF